MTQKVTTQEAIIRGYLLLVILPLSAFLIYGISFSAWLEGLKHQEEIDPEVFLYPIPILIVLLLLLAFGIPKGKKYYRQWAIDNVANLEEFRTRALKAKFIEKDDSELDELIRQEQKTKTGTIRNTPTPESTAQNKGWGDYSTAQENYVFYYTDEGFRKYIIGKTLCLFPQFIVGFIGLNIIHAITGFRLEYIGLAILGIILIRFIVFIKSQKRQCVRIDKYHLTIYFSSYFARKFIFIGFNLYEVAHIPWHSIVSVVSHNNKIKITAYGSDKRSQSKFIYTAIYSIPGSATSTAEIVEAANAFVPVRSNTDWKNEQ